MIFFASVRNLPIQFRELAQGGEEEVLLRQFSGGIFQQIPAAKYAHDA